MANHVNPEGWPQTRVHGWQELLDVLHDPERIPRDETVGGRHRSPYVFRGMSAAGWRLQTSLERLRTPPADVEPALLRAFRKYAPRGRLLRTRTGRRSRWGSTTGFPRGCWTGACLP